MKERFNSRALTAVLVGGVLVATMTLSTLGASALAGQSESETELQQEREALIRRLAELEARLAAARSGAAEALFEQRALAEELLVQSQREREQALLERRHVAEEAQREAQEHARQRLRVTPRMRFSGLPLRSGGSIDWIMAQAEELGLTDEQMARLRDARRAHRRAEIERDAAIEVAELDLSELLENEVDADLASVQTALETISSLRVEERIADLRLTQDSYAVLTAEQRDQLEEMRHTGLRGMLLHRDQDDGPAAYWFGPDESAVFEFKSAPGFVLDGLQDLDFGAFSEFQFQPFGDFEFHDGGVFEFDQNMPFGRFFELLRERDHDRDDQDSDQDSDQDQGLERSSRSAGPQAGSVTATATL